MLSSFVYVNPQTNLNSDIRLTNAFQNKISLANRIDSSLVSFNGISLSDWFDFLL